MSRFNSLTVGSKIIFFNMTAVIHGFATLSVIIEEKHKPFQRRKENY